MAIRSRPYRGEDDYHRVRTLLIESYSLSQRLHNWGLDRWDVFRFSGHARDEIAGTRPWERDVRLWEDNDGKLVGAVHPEETGDVWLEIHPAHRHLEAEMLTWAEEHHCASRPEGAKRWPLRTYVYDYDKKRRALLARCGYRNLGMAGHLRRRYMGGPLPPGPLPSGYAVRHVRDDDKDWARCAEVENRAFNTEFHTADTIRVRLRAPTYRPDLDLVVVSPDGAFAAFCIVWLDEANRYGLFEPVGTHPAHRRRGLASAVMAEGLRRLEALGGSVAYVGVGTGSAANRLYESLGFTGRDEIYHWQKEF
jgi:ribosomal protein S18 acetylase RimI-like enzyme